MNTALSANFRYSVIAALAVVVTCCLVYFLIEPQVSRAVTSGPFSIRQDVGSEISFLVDAANVTMSGTLNGLTGGTATGTTHAVVRSNAPNGYYMEIAFSDSDTDGVIMRRDLGGSQSASIRNYSTSSVPMTEPGYGFSTASTAAVFAYTVNASNTDDIDPSFVHDGSGLCNEGSDVTPNMCWMTPATTSFRIIDRSTSAPQGATSTVRFRVYIPNNPNPGVDSGFYTATATLTAVNNP